MIATILSGVDLGQKWFPMNGNVTIIVPGRHPVKNGVVVFPPHRVGVSTPAGRDFETHSVDIHSGGDGSPGEQGR